MPNILVYKKLGKESVSIESNSNSYLIVSPEIGMNKEI